MNDENQHFDDESDEEEEMEQIEDVEDLKQRRKLQTLLDAEEEAREMRKKAKLGQRGGSAAGVAAYRALVEDYLLILRPLIKNHNEKLWESKKLGTLTIQPPTAAEFFSDLPDQEKHEDGRPRFGTARGLKELQPRVYEFTGLKSIIEADSAFVETWTVIHEPAGGGKKRKPETKREDIPVEIVDKAFEHATNFANEHGFGFSTEESDPHGRT